MQEKIFESAASQPEGTPFTLTHALKVAESFEMGKVSQQLVNNGGSEGQLSRISQHQQNKRAVRQPQKSNNNSIKDNNKCGNCGKTGHSSKLNDRRLNCPAFDKVCGKCKTNGHFSDQCRGGPRDKREKPQQKDKGKVNEVKEKEVKDAEHEKDKDTASLGTLNGSWFLLNSLQDPVSSGFINEVQDVFTSVTS